jgi:hypothetical protein
VLGEAATLTAEPVLQGFSILVADMFEGVPRA